MLIPSVVSPFGVYLCRIYAEAAVPDELLEAARIDGAGECARSSRTLVLRMMTPALVTVFLFQFVGIWNNYFLPLVMLSDSEALPDHAGPDVLAGVRRPAARALPAHRRRRVPLGRPADDRDGRPAALLALRPDPGQREGLMSDL